MHSILHKFHKDENLLLVQIHQQFSTHPQLNIICSGRVENFVKPW